VQQVPDMNAVVFIIDDDASLREALKRTMRSVGLDAEAFGSTTEFLQSVRPDVASCLILDVRLPGLSGLDFQAELAKTGTSIPIIFITGHADIPMTVKAMKAGALEFLTKPVRDQDLLDAVRVALDRDRARREHDESVSALRGRLATLTARERQIIELVTSGLMNKQIAGELGVSEITVKVHRGNLMKKMGAKSVAELVRMADLLDITSHKDTR
jgi:FixJ family two-component response regulator